MPYLPRSTLEKTPIRVPQVDLRLIARQPPSQTQVRLAAQRAVLASFGITDLSSLGTLSLSGNVVPSPGLLRPQPTIAHGSTTFESAFRFGARGRGKTAQLARIGGTAVVLVAEPFPRLPPRLGSAPRHARRAAPAGGTIPIDAAYWAATTITIADDTTVVLQYPNRYLVIIAETLNVGRNVTFTWQRPQPSPGSLPAKPATPHAPPAMPTATTIAKPPAGHPGTPGTAQTQPAPSGEAGAQIELWLLALNGSPAFDLAGQGYDANFWPIFKGGPGGDGGPGGAGAPGKPDATSFGFCSSGPGNGGDGGKGGRAGDGGPGGSGGAGGSLSVYAPQSVLTAYQRSFFVTVAGGAAGPGGDPGQPGPGGPGGARGDNSHGCQPGKDPSTGKPAVRSAGNPGAQGDLGSPGRPGTAGDDGTISMQPIDPDAFRRELLAPTIVGLSSPNAKEGDSITLAGVNLTATDSVLVGGVAARTTPIADTALTFVVPRVAGGSQTVQVRQSDGTLSNRATLYVMPVLTAASSAATTAAMAGRLRPGATVQLHGSGFATGMSVRVGGEGQPDVVVTDPDSASFTLVRPASAPSSEGGEPVSIDVVLPQASPWSASNSLPAVLETFVFLVVGDSIAWGQGLEEQEKCHFLVEQEVRRRNGGIGVYKTVLAHSGAILGLTPPDDEPLPPLPGEVPSSYPTIPRQVASFASDPEEVDLVLVDGGINDVSVVQILDPLTSTTTLAQQTQTHCHDDMLFLLKSLVVGDAGASPRFPNARVIVTGYYQIISGQSDTRLLDALLIAIGLDLGGIPGAVVGAAIAEETVATIVANAAAFATEANAQLKQAVADANALLGAAGPRVFFADPGFGPENAALAPNALVFGINPDLSPQDPVAASRAPACSAAGSRTVFEECTHASAGHPNPAGAQRYASVAIGLL